MERDNFCCSAFKDRLHNGGHKGFAIIPVKSLLKSEEYAYFFQSRNVDENDEKSRHTIIDAGILYCPWCGTKLSEVTRLNREAITEIAKRNQHLIKV